MTINIKMMTEEAYRSLCKNHKKVYEQICSHPSDSTWLESFLGFYPFEEKKYEIEDFELLYSEDYSMVSVQNGIILFESLKVLPQHILSNSRFWAWVLFEKFYKQAQVAIKFTEGTIKTRWLINNSRRALMLGVISRQYYKVFTAYDEFAEDKYWLASFILKNHNPYKNLAFRNIGMLKNVALPYLRVIKEAYESNGITLNDDYCSGLLNEASMMGSVMHIDVISDQDVYNTLKEASCHLIDQLNRE